MPSKCLYLFALFGGFDVDLGPFLEGLPEDMSDKRLTGNLHGHHVPGSFQHGLGSAELTANIVLGELHGLSRELLCLVTLVAVSQIFSKLLWGQSKLFGQTICNEKGRNEELECRTKQLDR